MCGHQHPFTCMCKVPVYLMGVWFWFSSCLSRSLLVWTFLSPLPAVKMYRFYFSAIMTEYYEKTRNLRMPAECFCLISQLLVSAAEMQTQILLWQWMHRYEHYESSSTAAAIQLKAPINPGSRHLPVSCYQYEDMMLSGVITAAFTRSVCVLWLAAEAEGESI